MKMERKYSLLVLVCSLVIVYGAGFLGSLVTIGEVNGAWYTSVKPSITPPSWIFPWVWNFLFFLIALCLWRSWMRATEREKQHVAFWYGINLVLNVAWSFLYFRHHAPAAAFIDLILLWVSIIGMMVVSYRIRPKYVWFLVPYLAWVSFAGILNYLSVAFL